jgi:hypothetical protein
MAQYKGVLFFAGGINGWTETYYPVASTPAGAAVNLLAIATARVDILHTACFIGRATISDVIIRGDSTSILSTPEPGTSVDVAGFLDLDCALIVRWQVGVYARNKTFIRGVPVGQTFDMIYDPTVGYSAAFANYISVVIANSVMPITTRNPTPPPNYNIVAYASITAGMINGRLGRRKSGRPSDLPRGRRVAP